MRTKVQCPVTKSWVFLNWAKGETGDCPEYPFANHSVPGHTLESLDGWLAARYAGSPSLFYVQHDRKQDRWALFELRRNPNTKRPRLTLIRTCEASEIAWTVPKLPKTILSGEIAMKCAGFDTDPPQLQRVFRPNESTLVEEYKVGPSMWGYKVYAPGGTAKITYHQGRRWRSHENLETPAK